MRTPAATAAYGQHPQQVIDLYLPQPRTTVGERLTTTVVLIHGGFWAVGYDRELELALVDDLVEAGFPVVNLDYRGVGDGGGWPGTFADVAAGLDLLVPLTLAHGLAVDRTVVIGHSAGGHLALWSAARQNLPDGAPGAQPTLRPAGVVAQAAVADLEAAARDQLGEGAVRALLGGSPQEFPERYALADPMTLGPLGIPVLVVSGTRDSRVPHSQSEAFAQRAHAGGDAVQLVLVEGEDHFEHLHPGSGVWAATRDWLAALDEGRL